MIRKASRVFLVSLMLGACHSIREANVTESAWNLVSPPGARTQSTILLVWDKPENYEAIEGYEVYCGGRLIGRTRFADFTAEGLEAGAKYSFTVRSYSRGGAFSGFSKPVTVSTRALGQTVDIRDHGAVGDGSTLNTKAIQDAIRACPRGGTVLVPAGVFRTGALFLKSEMTLHVSAGGILLGSADPADYPLIPSRWEGRQRESYSSLLNGGSMKEGISDVVISGAGTIDGSGSKLMKAEMANEEKTARGRVICFINSDAIYMEGVTVRQPPAWCVHFIYCQNVTANRITVNTTFDDYGNRYSIGNGDGFNPDSTRHVTVVDSTFLTGDDSIAIKSGRDEFGRRVGKPSEQIRISNCRFIAGLGVAIGSEMSGGVRDVRVEDCTFSRAAFLAQIKTPRGRGGVVENVLFRDISYGDGFFAENEWFRAPITLDAYYGTIDPDTQEVLEVSEGTPQVRNITFRNITISNPLGRAALLRGLPEAPYRNIRLENISAAADFGIEGENLEGVYLDRVSVKADPGPAFSWKNVNELLTTGEGGSSLPMPELEYGPAPDGRNILRDGDFSGKDDAWRRSGAEIVTNEAGKSFLRLAPGKSFVFQAVAEGFSPLQRYTFLVRARTGTAKQMGWDDITFGSISFKDSGGKGLGWNNLCVAGRKFREPRISGIIPPGTAVIEVEVSGGGTHVTDVERIMLVVEDR